MTFPTLHIGHSRHGLFFTRWIVNHMLNLLKRTMTYPGFEPGTLGLAVSIANHYHLGCKTKHFHIPQIIHFKMETIFKVAILH
jgi:hypothetical protein